MLIARPHDQGPNGKASRVSGSSKTHVLTCLDDDMPHEWSMAAKSGRRGVRLFGFSADRRATIVRRIAALPFRKCNVFKFISRSLGPFAEGLALDQGSALLGVVVTFG